MEFKAKNKIPSVSSLYKPTLQALVELGGSGHIDEINEKVYDIADLSDEVLSVPHGLDGRSKVDYRLAWVRTRLKLAGLIENSSRGVWSLTSSELNLDKITVANINKKSLNVINNKLEERKLDLSFTDNVESKIEIEPEIEPSFFSVGEDNIDDFLEANPQFCTTQKRVDTARVEDEEFAPWKEKLLAKLYTISPSSFEKLAQRILRESGFTQVEVVGKSGDGGIDGKGILKLNGFLSFRVIFQCKRYRSSVCPSQIRDFRGAMQGRADKGLFITTGTFTRDAVKEATRDGAPAIDLIDGELLCEKLKELNLGVNTQIVESITINNDWFDKI